MHICRIYVAKALFPNRKEEKTFVVSLRTGILYRLSNNDSSKSHPMHSVPPSPPQVPQAYSSGAETFYAVGTSCMPKYVQIRRAGRVAPFRLQFIHIHRISLLQPLSPPTKNSIRHPYSHIIESQIKTYTMYKNHVVTHESRLRINSIISQKPW